MSQRQLAVDVSVACFPLASVTFDVVGLGHRKPKYNKQPNGGVKIGCQNGVKQHRPATKTFSSNIIHSFIVAIHVALSCIVSNVARCCRCNLGAVSRCS